MMGALRRLLRHDLRICDTMRSLVGSLKVAFALESPTFRFFGNQDSSAC